MILKMVRGVGMGEELVERRLAAILAADVVGYSRLMEANEERTMGALRQHRREFFDPTVAKHKGRIFKVMGDGFLVEFGSVIDAARCAVEIQTGMPERNLGAPEDRHIKFRIGINLGDVIVDGDDFYGDGVNMATRLEALAMPGGIACSATVRTHVGNKLEIEFLDQGEKTVKNIAQPVHVYFINLAAPATEAAPATGAQARARSDKPSVAVLPFANMSNDPEQEYFSDGITEDIITDLSKVSGLSVLSRNTVFTLKGKALNLQQVARQLGVAYVVEGSVRKVGNRVRITAQLIEGTTDRHLWADRYDRDLTDIFELQDEITKTIVAQLKVTLLPEEKQAIEQAPTNDVEAYTSYLKGLKFLRNGTKSSLLSAQQLFARAVELDPNYARAYASAANCSSRLKSQHGAEISVNEIIAVTDKALAINPDLAEAYAARGHALAVDDRRAEAVTAFEQALSLDPNSYEAHHYFGRYLIHIGDYSQAAEHFMRATEIWPDDYEPPLFASQALSTLRQHSKVHTYGQIGIKRAKEALLRHPENSRPAQLIAPTYAYLGEAEQAKAWLARALEIDPDDNLVRYNAACTYAQLGDSDKAVDLLEIWIRGVARDAKLWFENDPDFDPIRSHPRFQKFLELAR